VPGTVLGRAVKAVFDRHSPDALKAARSTAPGGECPAGRTWFRGGGNRSSSRTRSPTTRSAEARAIPRPRTSPRKYRIRRRRPRRAAAMEFVLEGLHQCSAARQGRDRRRASLPRHVRGHGARYEKARRAPRPPRATPRRASRRSARWITATRGSIRRSGDEERLEKLLQISSDPDGQDGDVEDALRALEERRARQLGLLDERLTIEGLTAGSSNAIGR